MADWIAHDGGQCPVPDDAMVRVRFRPRHPNERRVSESSPGRAGFWRTVGTDWWRHCSPNRDNDIMAYQFSDPTPQPRSEK